MYILISFLLAFSSALLVFLSKKKKEFYKRSILETEKYGLQIEKFFDDLLSYKERYVSHREIVSAVEKWKTLFCELEKLDIKRKHPLYDSYCKFKSVFNNIFDFFEKENCRFIKEQNEKYDGFFSNIDGKSLDFQQREAVLTDEERTLVLAGAGSGKTLTIAAKVKYLVEIQKIDPRDILLISFTKKACEEMNERIQKRLGVFIEAVTFHKLGLDIIKKSENFRPDVYDDIQDFLKNFFENEILNHNDLIKNITEYFAYYLEIPENLESFSSLGEAYEAEKICDLETLKSKYEKEKFISERKKENAEFHMTLRGERMKSLEETKIANFLFMNGVNYEYETLYKYGSGDRMRKSYRPDFYLPDHNIYLEHFGITKDYRCPWLSPVEEKKYIEEIKWKREIHKKNDTKLIETYSFNSSDGNLFIVLENLLKENGVELKSRDFYDVFETIYKKKSEKYFSEFIKLCGTFIVLFKSNNYKTEKLDEMKEKKRFLFNQFKNERTKLFLDIIKVIFAEYQKFLKENRFVDFSDMINSASEKVSEGDFLKNYKYIIVDEYQDISFSRFYLLKAVTEKSGAKLFCVGDDWQSIYRFAGSDILLFVDFEKYFGHAKILKIEKTYRNSQTLIDEASSFILKNRFQLKKDLRSDKTLDHPIVFWGYNKEPYQELTLIMEKIISEFGSEKSILILGRNNFDKEILTKSGAFKVTERKDKCKVIYLNSPKTPVSFLSIHKSKGIESDNVIVLNFKNDRLGFPNKIADDDVLDLVLAKEDDFEFSEERRLFYVALTRTKNRIFILVDNDSPSQFFKEFKPSRSVCFVSTEDKESKNFCPRCKTGKLLIREHNGSKFIGCSNFPKCRFRLRDAAILKDPKKCPSCGGFLVRRKGTNGSFWGCSNYPYCRYTENIKTY